jgi:hypothetical protein
MRRAIADLARSEGAFPAAYSKMLVSTKAAAIDFFTLQAADRLSFASPILGGKKFVKPLISLHSEFLILAQRMQIVGHEPTHRGIVFGRLSSCAAIDVVINTNGDVLHDSHSNCETVGTSSRIPLVEKAVALD